LEGPSLGVTELLTKVLDTGRHRDPRLLQVFGTQLRPREPQGRPHDPVAQAARILPAEQRIQTLSRIGPDGRPAPPESGVDEVQHRLCDWNQVRRTVVETGQKDLARLARTICPGREARRWKKSAGGQEGGAFRIWKNLRVPHVQGAAAGSGN